MDVIKKLIRYISDSNYRLVINTSRLGMNRDVPDEEYLKRAFKAFHGYEPDLKHPKTLNEKMQWLKLHDRKDIYTVMVDKYEAKKYVSKLIGEQYIIPTLGVWEYFDDIDFSQLPASFVLKCTHDSGSVVLVKDKNHWDKEVAKKKLERGLARNYYWSGREWPYKNVKPRIIAEKLVDLNPTDYKWICINGEPKVLCICMDRQKNTLTFDYFDMDFNHLPFEWVHPSCGNKKIKRPEKFDEMKDLAKQLSADIPEVRVDFYDIDGEIYFGELTFYHESGFAPFYPKEWDYKLGQLLDLKNIKHT
ncbi:ATP-grasp fold amidoligase family protein [uncultured Acidaminococcus sp.]|uniref:ATP-grasp fold amidoligase family protein n=1 Tax=uncultured Acidaminococcus sp. TaxID=352152 RepID=UPI0029428549|nr:ATP-grasp fold amidoligase family protein [uncultured Acidaminococcus sp.]